MDRSTTWLQTWMWPPGLEHAVCFNYLPLESTWCVLLTIRNVVLLSPQFYPHSRLHKKIIITALQYVSILTTSGQSPDDTCLWNPCSVFWLPTNSGAAQQQHLSVDFVQHDFAWEIFIYWESHAFRTIQISSGCFVRMFASLPTQCFRWRVLSFKSLLLFLPLCALIAHFLKIK